MEFKRVTIRDKSEIWKSVGVSIKIKFLPLYSVLYVLYRWLRIVIESFVIRTSLEFDIELPNVAQANEWLS